MTTHNEGAAVHDLRPIHPPLRPGQLVQCAKCYCLTAFAVADMAAPTGTFYCDPECRPDREQEGGQS